jgi:hypothetical protein
MGLSGKLAGWQARSQRRIEAAVWERDGPEGEGAWLVCKAGGFVRRR